MDALIKVEKESGPDDNKRLTFEKIKGAQLPGEPVRFHTRGVCIGEDEDGEPAYAGLAVAGLAVDVVAQAQAAESALAFESQVLDSLRAGPLSVVSICMELFGLSREGVKSHHRSQVQAVLAALGQASAEVRGTDNARKWALIDG